MNLKIRMALLTDVPKICEVAEATWKQTYAPIITQEQIDYMYEQMYTTEALKEQMLNGHTFLMCMDGGRILGFLCYVIREDDILYIPKLYVKPEAQRKGIGMLLLNEAEKIARRIRLTALELNVNRKNPAMYFYKKCGFELVEKVDIAYGKFWLNDYVLRKRIS